MSETRQNTDFIREIIAEDLKSGKHSKIVTRFPPEPNGFLHIGHAKSICLNFGVAAESGGMTNLRFDDTNPTTEEDRYVRAIQEDVRWLGFDWEDRLYFASDYYGKLYEFAVELTRKGLAYVDDLSADEIREYRGTLTEPGRESPHRGRSIEENLDLLDRMRKGEFPDGSRVLRAKIDMTSGNLNMRDPVLYRILRAHHHRTGDTWCIYPMYDFAHPLSDALEGITHSLCTLEFQDHRPLYDWFVENTSVPAKPRQIEFARLNLTHTVLSKRRLLRLVEEGRVSGWDDPRMPTLAGMRRRGYPPAAIRAFCDLIGMSKTDSTTVDIGKLEFCLREELNRIAPRVMAVLHPLKLVIENYPEGKTEEVEAINNPEDPSAGTRGIPFSREIWIERDDFMENPPKKFFRLAPGREVRLKHAGLVTCRDVVRDASGGIAELRCTWDPESRGGEAPDGRRVQGTLHWVSAAQALPAEVRLYDHLFTAEFPGSGGRDFLDDLNPSSLDALTGCFVEPSLGGVGPGSCYQFLRQGYFCVDPDSTPARLVINRTLGLRDSWAKLQKKGKA
ncbi:MAG TPA: glutamine--tRNA ligase/YqeY domain fusion protein [Candidatus Saccharimonadales bacterium]|nr:glutamine--tRNA ligase/YqeY domain fusion protein [Candidatus Saccharimonadales bacterium]